jgi:hypothetical protein
VFRGRIAASGDLPPGGQADRLALAVFGALRDRSEEDRRFVLSALEALDSRVGASFYQHAVEGLRLAEAEQGAFPSYRAYERWRLSQPEPGAWPSGSSIGRAFGSWSAMLDQLGVEPMARPQAIALRARGRQFSHEELLTAVRLFVAAQSPAERLTFKRYRAWARDRNFEDHTGLTGEEVARRVPVSSDPFKREFGSFAQAMAEAGLQIPHYRMGRPHHSFSPTEIVDALRAAAKDSGERALRVASYNRWRETRLDRAYGAGRALHLPSEGAIFTTFGDWASALCAAGLINESDVAHVRRRGSQRSLEPSVAARELLRAIDEIGPPITRRRYAAWRDRQPRTITGKPEAPSDFSLHKVFGPWAVVIAEAFELRDQPRAVERLASWMEARHNGLIHDPELKRVYRAGHHRGLEASVAARELLLALNEVGPSMSRSEYHMWRRRQPLTVSGYPRAPTDGALHEVFGPWGMLVSIARELLDSPTAVDELAAWMEARRKARDDST